MQSRDFCYWLQGYFELAPKGALSETQVEGIKAHLSLVFAHEIDPKMGDAAHQAKLNNIHGPGGVLGPNQIMARC